MQYNGGKGHVARELAAVLSGAAAGLAYWEPFVGAGNVIQHVHASRRLGSDADGHIIAYLNAIRDGWTPPTSLTEEEYKTLQACRDCSGDALVAFAGYGCSFGGKFFAGYARREGSNAETFATYASRGAGKQRPLLQAVDFVHAPYWEMPFGHADVIYCDPPYAGTTRCGSGKAFDSARFWAWAQERARESIVLVSEFSAPSFSVEVWAKSKAAALRKTDGTAMVERLFLVPKT